MPGLRHRESGSRQDRLRRLPHDGVVAILSLSRGSRASSAGGRRTSRPGDEPHGRMGVHGGIPQLESTMTKASVMEDPGWSWSTRVAQVLGSALGQSKSQRTSMTGSQTVRGCTLRYSPEFPHGDPHAIDLQAAVRWCSSHLLQPRPPSEFHRLARAGRLPYEFGAPFPMITLPMLVK